MSTQPAAADAQPETDTTQEIGPPVRTGEPVWAGDVEELARLRAEVADLNARLDTRHRRASTIHTLRRVTAAVLIAITAFALVAGVVGVWSARTALNTDRWVATIAPLPQDPQVAAAVADYATNQVFSAIDVQQRVANVLPAQAAFVAGPIAGQLHDAVEKTVYNVLQSAQFQRIWVELNRRAHDRAVAILNGESNVVVARDDRVEIDLLPLINQVLRALSAQLPTMFGKQINLPDLSSGAIPDNLRTRVQDSLGVTLPANFAQFTVYDSGQLKAVQRAVSTAKRDLVLFVVATVALFGLALLISPGRRRTLLQLGLWLVVAAVAVGAVIRAVKDQILGEIPAGLYRDGAAAAITTVFSQLRVRGDQIIWIGAILAAVMYLIGPGRGPTWLRHQGARGARAVGRWTRTGGRAVVTHGPGFTARHLDALRVGGLVVAVALALILSSWTALLVIVVALAAYEVGVTLVARSVATAEPETPVDEATTPGPA
ncbi:hypothetical protein [Krasilnikovia sp. MM14-A1259]|uniref:hypothetical protein n=1 Tax=Krasilnikovia sp. MM14-A1259 TaxID=3373539 RepID=UPI0038166C7B